MRDAESTGDSPRGAQQSGQRTRSLRDRLVEAIALVQASPRPETWLFGPGGFRAGQSVSRRLQAPQRRHSGVSRTKLAHYTTACRLINATPDSASVATTDPTRSTDR